MRIALLQINPTAGDLSGNSSLIVSGVRAAASLGAELVVTPELALMGYLPRDLLMNRGFVRRAGATLDGMAAELKGAPPALIGVATPNPGEMGRPLFNSAVLLKDGAAGPVFHKTLLPTYDVFDEDRYFEPGSGPQILELGGWRLGISICEDVWNDRDFWSRRRYHEDPIEELAKAGAQAIVNLSASPFTAGKQLVREKMLGHLARKYGLPVAYVNQVGGNDDLIFDGRSGVFDAQGGVSARARGFEEDLLMADLGGAAGTVAEDDFEPEAEIWRALVLGVRDYARKTGFRKAVLGLSGGIDSALTAAIAADALGPGNVQGVMMPSCFSSRGSVDDSVELARNLGIATRILPIAGIMGTYDKALAEVFRGLRAGRHRGEHSIPNTGQPAHGALEQIRLAAAHDGQQIGNIGGVLHALRGHERRAGGDRGSSEDDGVPGGALAQPAQPGHSGGDPDEGPLGGAAAGANGPGQPAALRLARCDSGAAHRALPVGRGNHRAGLRRGDGAAGDAAGAAGGIQAEAGGSGAQGDLQGVWHGLAHADCAAGVTLPSRRRRATRCPGSGNLMHQHPLHPADRRKPPRAERRERRSTGWLARARRALQWH